MPTATTFAWRNLTVAAALAGLALGAALYPFGLTTLAGWAWAATTVGVLVPTLVSAAQQLRARETGVDIIAILAMVGTLLLGEHLAGAIIAVMLTGGAALERFAVARARRDLTALLSRAPRIAHRRQAEAIIDVDVAQVEVGDALVVKPGEVVPADGILQSATAVLDESALTGEANPVTLELGAQLRSGVTNAGSPLELRVTAAASESTYAAVIRLVRAAEGSKARFVRAADRYALGFLVLALVMGAAAWLISGDPHRALAVLVVATPCPLILAAPAAMVAGVSRAAKHGIIVKGGAPLETLAKTTTLLLDKTGTVTAATPRVIAVESFGARSVDDIVAHAAALERMSAHPFAPAILREARDRSIDTAMPTDVHEQMGTGIRGRVRDKAVAVGQLSWVAPDAPTTNAMRSLARRTGIEGSSSVFVGIDGQLAGAMVLQDPIRPEAPRALRSLRKLGIERIYMVTGDHPDVAELVADVLGTDRMFAQRTPEEKVEVVKLVRPEGVTAMVGDGINDAPALAAADVGIAMGARGATAASEAADVVLTSDRLETLVLAIAIAQRTRRIMLQSVFVGMGLSVAAMIAAAAGLLVPVAGAVLQEGIDVLVIFNALRALGGGGLARVGTVKDRELVGKLAQDHGNLRPKVAELPNLAARLDRLEPKAALIELVRVRDMLEHDLLPHEQEEQRLAYPALERMLKFEDPTGPLIQTHHEIRRLIRLYSRLVAALPPEGPGWQDLRDLQRALYGLHAVLSLHFAQEEELYSSFS